MRFYIALLRGINVGGNNIIPMSKLREMCIELGFAEVRTYIQSGNILFRSDFSEQELIARLEKSLETQVGKHISVVIRSAKEIETVISKNPFSDSNPAQVGISFFTQLVSENYLKDFVNPGSEEIVVSGREIYIHYPNGMGQSKLKLPKMQEQGTARNLNTVRKLVEMSRENDF
ncbi:MAG: DUF1697 domain-containing protein [Draconibacterium sp.]|nr:DUF1697 domain-containing protein [Draconibacterium sp.]